MMIVPGSAFMPRSVAYTNPNSYIVSLVADSGPTKGHPTLDSTETGEATWEANFKEFLSTGLFVYEDETSAISTISGLSTHTMNLPRLGKMRMFISNAFWNNDWAEADWEFLDSSDTCVFAMRFRRKTDQQFRTLVWYGANLSSLSAASQAGAFPHYTIGGKLTFNPTNVSFANDVNQDLSSFTFNCSSQTVTKLRVTNVFVESTNTANAGAYAMLTLRYTDEA